MRAGPGSGICPWIYFWGDPACPEKLSILPQQTEGEALGVASCQRSSRVARWGSQEGRHFQGPWGAQWRQNGEGNEGWGCGRGLPAPRGGCPGPAWPSSCRVLAGKAARVPR